ncbi:MAG: 1-acyl-sn-glycerol-3-phosphate acyltransferase [Treponema sp.]|jgi:1-acyl-sn-glycerol-3-phosphate acyltransferase|nr:1-acyl-sn-glycerol-3-phosphate acyltransferase [Treponema sp.]
MEKRKGNNGVFHLIIWRVVWLLVAPVLSVVFQYRRRLFRPEDYGLRPGQKLPPLFVIPNHVNNLDPFFAGYSFFDHLYFVSSEHALRKGFGSQLLRFFFGPIPIIKGTTDTAALKEILKRLKAGRNVCLFAEGNRSFSGVTGDFSPATGKLVRLAASTAGAALVTYRIRGGYFAFPRWARKMRTGRIWGEPVRYYPPAAVKAMTPDEINAHIRADIFEDAYQTMAEHPRPYRCNNPAEDLETALYLCPSCGKLGTLYSRGDMLYCGCGLSVHYDEYGALHTTLPSGIRPVHEPFSTVRDWWLWEYRAVEEMVRAEGFVCRDSGESLYEVTGGKAASLLVRGELSLSREGLRLVPEGSASDGGSPDASLFFPLNAIMDLVITDQRTLSFFSEGKLYELKDEGAPVPGGKQAYRSAAKYTRIFAILSGALGDANSQ